MATRYFLGASLNTRQRATLVITGAGATSDTITLTIANVDFVVTVGGTTTTAGIATTVQQAYEATTLTDTTASATISVADGGAKTIPQFSEYTATVSGSTVTFLGNQTSTTTPGIFGKPITMSGAKSGTVTITFTADATTPTSQFHWNQADNWSGNTVPVDGDTVIFDRGNIDLRYLMTGSIQVAQLTKYKSYTGNVGLAPINIDNSSKPYSEYRTPLYLTFDDDVGTAATVADLEVGDGQGSGRFMVDFGAGEATINVYGKGNRADSNTPCILLKGTAIAELNNLAGDVGVAVLASETSTVTTLRSGDSPSSQANTVVGSGVALTTAVINGGTAATQCTATITTGTQNGGIWQHSGGTITTLNILGGTFYQLGNGTITTINLAGGGVLDCTKGSDTFTITNSVQMYKGSKFLDPTGRSGAAVGAGYPIFTLNQCTLADVTIVLAPNKKYTLAAP